MTGRTLAHYEVAEKLGEGGMGTVYKARDLHLDRFVGIKFLRADKHRDAERKRRFILEAKAASALNHPNIITIHDAGTVDDTDYIVMEYVKGQTLASMIGRRGMPLGDVLKYGIQIADALAAAHSAGIVHRDLKPANVMIAATDGRVKVLDFGLAKLTEVVTPDPDEPTQTIRADDTEEGQILGTTAYMAPEQVEGKKVDARTDIFAFGLMLYEMVTGKRAFERDSRMGTLTAILKEQQTPAGELVTGVPNELDKIVARCLRKEPERRYQTMRDVANALQELKEDSESGRLSSSSIPHQATTRPNRTLLLAAVAVAVISAVAVGVWLATRPGPTQPLVLRKLTDDPGITGEAAISPDGKFVAYSSDRATEKDADIWLHPLGEGAQPIRLTRNPANDRMPVFSPDGAMIAFVSLRDPMGIYIIPSLGGEERLLARGGVLQRFSPDGKWIAYSSGFQANVRSAVFIMPVAGGPPRQVTTDVGFATQPVFSPNGESLLFLCASNANASDLDFCVVPVAGGASRRTNLAQRLKDKGRAITAAEMFDWVADKLVFSDGRRLWEVGLLPDGRPDGEPAPLTNSTNTEWAPKAVQLADRRLTVFAAGRNSSRLWSLPVDHATGRVNGDMKPLSRVSGAQVTPSGSFHSNKIVYTHIEADGAKLKVRDLATGAETVLVSGLMRGWLSPDGSKVAYSLFANVADVGPEIYVIPASGGDPVKAADMHPGRQRSAFRWAPDGKVVFYDGSPLRFWTVDPATRQVNELISHPNRDIHAAQFSSDGKWLAFLTPDGVRRPIYIAEVRNGRAAGESEWIAVPGIDGAWLMWAPDGNALYGISPKDGFQCLYRQALDKVTKRPVGEPVAVYHFHNARLTSVGPSGLTALSEQFIAALQERTSNVWIAEQRR